MTPWAIWPDQASTRATSSVSGDKRRNTVEMRRLSCRIVEFSWIVVAGEFGDWVRRELGSSLCAVEFNVIRCNFLMLHLLSFALVESMG